MKKCNRCFIEKSLSEFKLYHYTKTVKPYCNECGKVYQRNFYKKSYKSKCSGVASIEGEEWRKVNGSDNYFVSNFGRIKRNDKKVLTPEKTNRGYLRVLLSENNKMKKLSVHRVVAQAFIINKDNKPFVNHKDLNKENNHVSNLEWVTHSENCLHYIKNKIK